MIYFLALIPATALTIAGYVTLFMAHRSEGALRAFGKYLGFWAFTLAALVILGAVFAAGHGGRHGHRFHQGGHFGPPPLAAPPGPDGAGSSGVPPAPESPTTR